MRLSLKHVKKNKMLASSITLFILMTFTGLSSATASSIAAADIYAQLTFTKLPNDIELVLIDSFGVIDTFENGNGSAVAQAPDPLDLANGFQFEANAITTSSPTGSAFAVGAAFGSFDLINTTPNPIDVDFTVMYDWTILGFVDDSSLEQALSEIALDVFINDVSLTPIREGNITPSNFSMESGSGVQGTTITQVFSDFSIPAGTTFIDVAVAAQAEATSATVPEPSTFILLGSGIAGLAIYQRRRKS